MLLREVGYACPATVGEAVRLLSEYDGARPLAGGQTLINVMKARAASPDVVVDLQRLDELKTIDLAADGTLTLGASRNRLRRRRTCSRARGVRRCRGRARRGSRRRVRAALRRPRLLGVQAAGRRGGRRARRAAGGGARLMEPEVVNGATVALDV